jgi:hypothetical protein
MPKCKFYKYCGRYITNHISNTHNKCCINCDIQLGPYKSINDDEECPVCYTNKNSIQLMCNHKLCYECWYKLTNRYEYRCPICRFRNYWI